MSSLVNLPAGPATANLPRLSNGSSGGNGGALGCGHGADDGHGFAIARDRDALAALDPLQQPRQVRLRSVDIDDRGNHAAGTGAARGAGGGSRHGANVTNRVD